MNGKKLAVKRIFLFVLFSYGLYWISAGLCDLFADRREYGKKGKAA